MKELRGEVLYEKVGHVARFIIRGDTDLNIVNPKIYKQMYEHLTAFQRDPEVRVGLMFGAGEKHFSAGGDLNAAVDQFKVMGRTGRSYRVWYPWTEPLGPAILSEAVNVEVTKPIVGAVRGYCLGAAFALFLAHTDIRLATPDAMFALPQVRYGLPSSVASYLAKEVPRAVVMELIFRREFVGAERALSVGLITEIVPKERLMEVAEKWVTWLAQLPPLSVMMQKEIYLRSREMSVRDAHRFGRIAQFLVSHQEDEAEKGAAEFRQRKGQT